MKTQSRILLSAVSSLVISLVIAFIAFSILRDTSREFARNKILTEIIDKTYALHLLTVSLIEGSGRRDIRQVKELLWSLDTFLNGMNSKVTREEGLILQLRKSHQELGPLIDRLIITGDPSAGIERERRNIIASQIWMKVHYISEDSRRLRDISRSRISSAQENAFVAVIALIVLLALTNGAIYFLSGRGILRAQKALSESEERFRRYFELGLIGMAITSPSKGFVEVNDEICSILGYERPELFQKTWAELTHPDDLAADVVQFNRVMAGEIEGYTMEKRFVRRNARIVDTTISVRAIRRSNGSVDCFVVLLQDVTERKRAEVALRESVRRERDRSAELQTLLDLVPVPVIIVHDRESRHMSGNLAADTLLQQPRGSEISLSAPDEKRPRHFRAVKDGRDLRIDELPAQRAARGEHVNDFDFTLVFDNGTTRHVIGHGTPLLDEQGRPRGAVHVLVDMTERKLADEALRKSEERFRALVEASSDVLYRMSPDWTEMRQLHSRGFLLETEKPNLHWFEKYIHPDDRPHVAASIDRAIQTKGIFELEHRVRRADGSLGWTFSRAVPLLDANGEIVEWFGAASDITDRRLAEEALRESEERFRLAAKSARIGAYSRNLQTGEDYWSPEFLEIFGLGTGEVLPMEGGIPAAVHPEDRKLVMAEADARLTRIFEPEFSSEHRIILPSGEIRWVMIRGRLEFDDHGRALRTHGLAMDVTGRRKMEEDLRRSMNEMEARVLERTAELERKNRELQEFAYVASHDLSEPLRKIQTFGDLLKTRGADSLGKQERDYVSRMTGAACRMQELLDALLRYSRIETQAGDFIPLRLEEIVRMVTADLEVSIKETGTKVEIGTLPMISGDPYQWRQLFQNLISNAVKYHRSEVKPRIKILWEQNDGNCRILVEDNGIGFDEKYLDNIFQPFQRLHGKHEYPGTGIGLAICKKIVERHGGTITAKSTPGKGSTFVITLPVANPVLWNMAGS